MQACTLMKVQPKILLLIFLVVLQIISQHNVLTGQAKEQPQKCIMVFGAHADDVEVMAGGTFARYISEGYKGIYVCITNNTAGNAIEGVGGGTTPGDTPGMIFTVSDSPLKYPADGIETMQVRQEEARNAAAVFGATTVFLDFRESFIWQGRKACYIESDEFYKYQPPGRSVIGTATVFSENVSLVVKLLKEFKPEIVIIHTLGGDKNEHEASAYLVYAAFKRGMDQGIPVGKLLMRPKGWLIENPAKVTGRGKPDIRIDVTKFIGVKYEALNKHVSQNGGYMKQVLPDEVTEEFITVLDNARFPNPRKK